MPSTHIHPVVGLLDNLNKELSALEFKFPPLRRQIRDLRVDSLGSSAKALLGRTDLVDGNCKRDRHLRSKQGVVYWKIDRTFEHLLFDADKALTNVYEEINQVKAKREKIRDKIVEVEAEIIRDNLDESGPSGSSSTSQGDGLKAKLTGFLDLPAELRNQIYHLSGCLELTHEIFECMHPLCYEWSHCMGENGPNDWERIHTLGEM